MKDEKFFALIKKLEKSAQRNPQGYKRRVLALVLLGYGFIFLLLGFVIFAITGYIDLVASGYLSIRSILTLGAGLMSMLFVVLRSLCIWIEPPQGIPLTRAEVPRLFKLVDEIAAPLQSRMPDEVLLDTNFNCAVAQVPRVFIISGHRGYLLLGLPLLQAVSPEEFKAILAHEFGHLSANHSRFSGWIYRVRTAWTVLAEYSGLSLVPLFFKWYAPFFEAYSFVLARANEYVADRCAAEIGGPRAHADALLRVSAADTHFQETFWPEIYKQANWQASPPSPFADLKGVFAGISPARANRAINRALLEKTGETDTHPSLTDRLKALGERPRVPPALMRTAAEEYLGDALEQLTSTLNEKWRKETTWIWDSRYKEQQEELADFRERAEIAARGEEINEDDLLELARWREEFEGEDAGLAALEDFARRYPGNASGLFSLGRSLLARSNATDEPDFETARRAVELLNQVIDMNADEAVPACHIIHAYLCENNRGDEAELYLKKAEAHSKASYDAAAERGRIEPIDVFLPHEVDEVKLRALQDALAEKPSVAVAYLVRKQLLHSGPPLYLLGIVFQFNVRIDELECRQWADALKQSLPLPGESIVIPLHDSTMIYRKPFEAIAQSKIYPQP